MSDIPGSNQEITDHLVAAKSDIEAGDSSLRSAAEHVAAALALGASQAVIAIAVGKSQPLVNRLLKWRTGNFKKGGPFADDNAKAKISRTNKKPKPNKLQRDQLVKVLGMLGSDQVGEVVNAARHAERIRSSLGLTWSQLIVMPAAEQRKKAA